MDPLTAVPNDILKYILKFVPDIRPISVSCKRISVAISDYPDFKYWKATEDTQLLYILPKQIEYIDNMTLCTSIESYNKKMMKYFCKYASSYELNHGLNVAIVYQNAYVVEYLINCKADVNAEIYGDSMLVVAAEWATHDIVKILLKHDSHNDWEFAVRLSIECKKKDIADTLTTMLSKI